jgi:hypothetical protein
MNQTRTINHQTEEERFHKDFILIKIFFSLRGESEGNMNKEIPINKNGISR